MMSQLENIHAMGPFKWSVCRSIPIIHRCRNQQHVPMQTVLAARQGRPIPQQSQFDLTPWHRPLDGPIPLFGVSLHHT
jgi:hypothetical protein